MTRHGRQPIQTHLTRRIRRRGAAVVLAALAAAGAPDALLRAIPGAADGLAILAIATADAKSKKRNDDDNSPTKSSAKSSGAMSLPALTPAPSFAPAPTSSPAANASSNASSPSNASSSSNTSSSSNPSSAKSATKEPDSDGDGIPDRLEAKANGGKFDPNDRNGDGIPDNKQSGAARNATPGRPAGAAAASGPPPTVEAMFKQWFGPAAPPPAAAVATPFQQTVTPAPGTAAAAIAKPPATTPKAADAAIAKPLATTPKAADAAKASATVVEKDSDKSKTSATTSTQDSDKASTKSKSKTGQAATKPTAPEASKSTPSAAAMTAATAAARPATTPTATSQAKTAPGKTGRPPGFDANALPPADTYRPGEVLATNLPAPALDRAIGLGFKIKSTSSVASDTVTTLIAPPGRSVADAQVLLRDMAPEVPLALNRIYRPVPAAGDQTTPTSIDKTRLPVAAQSKPCDSDLCYGPSLINWRPNQSSCTSNVVVGVIDTAFDQNHPAFAGQENIHAAETLASGGKSVDRDHGTGVLAVLAGSRKSGTPGLIPDAKFIVSNIFYADDDGKPMSDSSSMLKALMLMSGLGAEIINMSVSGPYDENVEKAIAALANDKGVVFLAAAGNNGHKGEPSYPAAYKQVIAVTAVDKDLSRYRNGTHGAYIDVAAPGVDIWTAVPGAREGFQTGTSFAVPYATAVIATVLESIRPKTEADRLAKRFKTKDQILAGLPIQDLGPPGRDPMFGRGLLLSPPSCRLQKPGTHADPLVAANQPAKAPQATTSASPATTSTGIVPVSTSTTGPALGVHTLGEPAAASTGQQPWPPISGFMSAPNPATGSVNPAAARR